jgi:type I restriction enzyme S subunit
MGSEWQHLKLSEVAVFSYGKMPKKGKIGTGVYPTYSGYKYQYLYPEYNCDEGDLIVVARGVGGTGDVKLVNKRCYLTNLSIKINLDQSKIDNRYFYYFYLGAGLRHLDSGSAQSQITINDLGNVVLSVPPLQAQIKVVEILERLDNKITLNRQINTTLESMAQALFKSWFVDFDPVIDNALAAGNEIPDALQKRAAVRAARREALRQQTNKTTNKTTGATDAVSVEQPLPETGLSEQRLPPEIQQLFPDRFVLTEEMGWVPEGWEVEPIYSAAKFINGAAFKGIHFSPDNAGLPVVKIAELKAGVSGQTKFTTQSFDSKYKISDGDILFSWSGNPDTSIDTFIWQGGEGWLNQHIFKVELHDKTEYAFIFSLLKFLKPVFADIARDKQTTGLGHVTAGDMKKLYVMNPPSEVRRAFATLSGPLIERRNSSNFESSSLTNLRDSLLPKLLSGQITIPDAEQQLAEVL